MWPSVSQPPSLQPRDTSAAATPPKILPIPPPPRAPQSPPEPPQPPHCPGASREAAADKARVLPALPPGTGKLGQK